MKMVLFNKLKNYLGGFIYLLAWSYIIIIIIVFVALNLKYVTCKRPVRAYFTPFQDSSSPFSSPPLRIPNLLALVLLSIHLLKIWSMAPMIRFRDRSCSAPPWISALIFAVAVAVATGGFCFWCMEMGGGDVDVVLESHDNQVGPRFEYDWYLDEEEDDEEGR